MKSYLAFFLVAITGLLFVALSPLGSSVSSVRAEAQPAERDGGPGGPGEHFEGRHPGGGQSRKERIRQRLMRFQEELDDQDGDGAAPGGPGGDRGDLRGPVMAGAEMRAKRMGKLLDFMERFVTSVGDRHQAIGLAVLGIEQYYKKRGKIKETIPIFQEMLDNASDQTERNIYLFVLRQNYQELNEAEKVLELSKQIIRENSKKE